MKRIRLQGAASLVALVSDEDYAAVSRVRWVTDGAYAWTNRRHGVPGTSMHRMVLGLQHGDPRMADHINGDGLDNRRSNLRLATHAQNMQNRKPRRVGGTSRFRGVSWSTRSARWKACGQVNGVHHHIGLFVDEVAAAVAAEAWRKEHMPFAQPDPEVAKALGQAESENAA